MARVPEPPQQDEKQPHFEEVLEQVLLLHQQQSLCAQEQHQAPGSIRTTLPHTLHIVDWDGTLFRSPTPNPELWNSELQGNLISECLWFQDLRTLSPPGVPAHPGPGWWDVDVLRASRALHPDPGRRRREEGLLVILLTGRRGKTFAGRIREILAGYPEPITFDALLFREEDEPPITIPAFSSQPNSIPHGPKAEGGGRVFASTMDYKLRVLGHLLTRLPSLRHVEIWEDRPRDLQRFQDSLALSRIAPEHAVLHACRQDEVDRCWLPVDVERALVQDLVRGFNARREVGTSAPSARKHSLCLEEVVYYTAVVLEEESRDRLLERFPPPSPRWRPIAHHMTIGLGSAKELVERMGGLGARVAMEAVAWGQREDRVQAVRVEAPPGAAHPLLSKNAVKHVTLHVAPGAKPAESNAITEWSELEHPLPLAGHIAEVRLTRIQPQRAAAPIPPAAVSLGKLVQELHPHLRGRAIGEAVAQVQLDMQARGIRNAGEEERRIRECVAALRIGAGPDGWSVAAVDS